MSFEELGAKLKELEEARQMVQRELEALQGKRDELRELELDAAALLEAYKDAIPERLESLTPEGRHHIYKVLQLRCLLRVHFKTHLEAFKKVIVDPQLAQIQVSAVR